MKFYPDEWLRPGNESGYNTPKKDLSAVPPRGLSVVFALPVTVGFSVIPCCHSFRPDQGLVELAEADQQRTLIFFHM